MKLSIRGGAFAMGCLVVASLFFVACNKSSNNDNSNSPVSALMAFNLAPDRAVGITLSGNSITSSPLPFTSFSGGYLNIYSGNRSVETFDFNLGSSIASSSFTFDPQKYYSLFVTGAKGNYRNVIVKDNYDSLSTTSGKAYVRYINAIPDSSAPNVSIAVGGENALSSNAPFSSVSDFSAVSPGSATVQVSNGTTINKSRTITLEGQKAYTVLLVGVPGSTSSDSLQIRFVENGTLQQKTQKTSATVGSVNSK